MGSRGRSIRLRIYFLVAIPLIAMVGLLAYVVTTTSVDSAVSSTGCPTWSTRPRYRPRSSASSWSPSAPPPSSTLQPQTAANLAIAYQAAIAATNKAEVPAFHRGDDLPRHVNTEIARRGQDSSGHRHRLKQLPTLREAVKGRVISPIDAFGFYSRASADQTKLFLIQTESVVTTDQQGQAVGLIATVQAREELSQEHALLAGMLAGKRMTHKDRVAFTNMAATRQADMAYANYILTRRTWPRTTGSGAAGTYGSRIWPGIEQAIVAVSVARAAISNSGPAAAPGLGLPPGRTSTAGRRGRRAPGRDHRDQPSAPDQVSVTSATGLIGLLLTITVTILVARSIIRRLGGLEAQCPPACREPAAGRRRQAQARRERRR